MNKILFCSEVSDISKPHKAYADEFEVASKLTNTYLFDVYDLNSVKIPDGNYIYHGWMMPPAYYKLFYEKCNNALINTPQQYHFCHHFDQWYPTLFDVTPKSIIISKSLDLQYIVDQIIEFMNENDCGVILKDFVKSIKHKWKEACYIPKNSSPLAVMKVLMNFVTIKNSLQDFRGDIVVRKFVDLHVLGYKDETPMNKEARSFIKDGEIMISSSYWKGEFEFPIDFVKSIADVVYKTSKSSFFTIDIAQKINNDWTLIEIGDGQVSAIPDTMDKLDFFTKLIK